MRSISYVLRGNPKNLDDCLDLSLREKPVEVSLDLLTNETITEMYTLKQFIGRFIWGFPNRNVQYDEIFGGCFARETEKRQRKSIDNANRRLKNYLNRIKILGIDIIGQENKFDYSLIYKH